MAGSLPGIAKWGLPGALGELLRKFLAAAESNDCLACLELANAVALFPLPDPRLAGRDIRRLPASWLPAPLPPMSIPDIIYIKGRYYQYKLTLLGLLIF